jgi:hypothetical protein
MKGLQKFCLIFIAFATYVSGAQAQTQDSYDYQSEFTWGINKNTFGGLIGGLVFKKARKLNDRMLESFGLELMNVKHPLEIRRNSESGNYFIYGKSHYLYALRFQYGRDLIWFRKAPQQGVEIKAVGAIGPSLGLQAPYYVELEGDGSFGGIHKPYDATSPEMSAENIAGPGRPFEGLFSKDTDLRYGINLKAAINFELGTTKNQVTGFEAGFLLDAYAKKVELMAAGRQYSVFPTFFFTLFYGSRK